MVLDPLAAEQNKQRGQEFGNREEDAEEKQQEAHEKGVAPPGDHQELHHLQNTFASIKQQLVVKPHPLSQQQEIHVFDTRIDIDHRQGQA